MKNIAITENHLFKKAYAGGKKAGGRFTVIYVLKDKKAYMLKKANPQKEYVNRIGLTVTKKIGKAFQRNRAKRVIRAAFSQIQKERKIKKGYLIVISARDAATEVKSTEVLEEMRRQLERLDMFVVSAPEKPQISAAGAIKDAASEAFVSKEIQEDAK